MTVTLGNILKVAWTIPPRDFYRRTRLKLRRTFGGGTITVRDRFDADPNAGDWRRHFTTLTRMEAAAGHRLDGWGALDPAGRTVLEIGCGMTGGTGPLMLFRGAARVYGIDPQWDPSVLHDAYVVDAYYRPLWDFLCSIYGERLSFEAFMARLRADLTVTADTDVAKLRADGIDLVVSISCLEHIAGLEAAIAGLAAIGTATARHIHLVDFGNHWSKSEPFSGLYDAEWTRAVAANAPGINSLRLPDVTALFEAHGLSPRPLVFERRRLDAAAIHPSWLERYDAGDLGVRVATIFVG